MRSEHPGSPEPLVRLAGILAEAAGGVRPTPLELAELLWLARRMEPAAEPADTPSPTPSAKDVRPPGPAEKPPPKEHPAPAPTPQPESSRASLHLPTPTAPAPGTRTEPHTTLLAPAPPMLRHPLALQRSLRPLKRRTDAPARRELDERATADRIARLGAGPEWWLPVMRPAQERWLRLNLVYDSGPTMPVWRPLIRELHTALAQSGIFRTVHVYRAESDGTVRGHGTHTPTDGRTVTLLISDCAGPQWREGPAGTRWYDTLGRWAHRMPLAVVQPLPEHLWRDTALPTLPGLLSAPHPAAPNAALAFSPYDTSAPYGTETTVPLPVLEPGPRWLANWASLIATPGGTEFPGAAAVLGRPLPIDADDRTDLTRLSPEELVLRFRATASPEAFRLAGHLALGRPDLPVMRLVQAAVEPHPRPQHLAEVILSGMLTTTEGPPGSYGFRRGVREVLLRSLPRTARDRTADLLRRVGGLIEERAGRAPGEFRASTPAASGAQGVVDGEPFATISPESVARLSGGAGTTVSVPAGLWRRYRPLQRIGPSGRLWEAHDRETNRTVVVRMHPSLREPGRRQAFLRDARVLQGLVDRHVVTVHDYGTEDGVPFIVMEHLDGIALNSLAAPSGYRLPAPILVSLGQQLAHALTALHRAGVTHGGLDMTRVVLLPEGTAKLTLFELGRSSGQEGRSADLRALGRLLFDLASGGAAYTGAPVAPDRLRALPPTPRATYASAISHLMSRDLPVQQEGLAALREPHVSRQTKASYTQLHYSLLGRPTVRRGTPRPLATGSPQEQAMLCMLLLRHGRKVTHAQLTEGIWGRKPPARADALLGTYASRLRNALGPGVLAALSDGYTVHTSADFVDVAHCEVLVAQAKADRATGDTRAARARVSEALALWRGTALDGVPGPAAESARTRLLHLRLSLCATGAELDLELGEFERAAADLAGLLTEYPSREDFRRLHMIALRQLGRVAEALESYEEYELSGGRDPDLLALGHELREEHGVPREAQEPDRPTAERAGPGISTEERPGDTTGQASRDHQRTWVYYEFADGPQDLDTQAALGRAVTRRLAASGLAADDYELLTRNEGYSVLTALGVTALPLLVTTMAEFEDLLTELDGIRVVVTVWRMGNDGQAERVDTAAVRDVLGSPETRGVIAVPEAFRDELSRSGSARLLRPLGGSPASGWYRLALLPRMLYDGSHSQPLVRGPYPLSADLALPAAHGGTREVVYGSPQGEYSTIRTPDTDHYYEVGLIERRTELYETGRRLNGSAGFTARGEAKWRVADPVAAVRDGLRDADSFIRAHLLSQLRELAHTRRPMTTAQARAALDKRLTRHVVPGCAVRWHVTLTDHR